MTASQSTQEAWETWWHSTKSGSIRTYISIVLFFLSTVLANPIARCLFYIVRKACPKKWIWPNDARLMMMWQTSLMCRVGLLWITILVSRLSLLLYNWPAWIFGVCFIIWLEAGGNVLREVIVRNGVVGYMKDEKAGRMTLLYEGSTLAKMLLLVLIIYTYYVSPRIAESNELKLLFSVGFFGSIALGTLPLLRNVMGAHYMFLANMLHLDSKIYLHGSKKGTICDSPLGFIVLATPDHTKTFIPAGGTVSNTTEIFHRFLWPLRLDVHLPAKLSTKRVREFLQDMDELLLWDPVVVLASDGSATLDTEGTSPLVDASTPSETYSVHGMMEASELAIKLLFDDNRQEQERIIQRARGNDGYVALKPDTRWVIQLRTFVQAPQKAYYRQTRAACIEAITKLMEKQGNAFGARAAVIEPHPDED